VKKLIIISAVIITMFYILTFSCLGQEGQVWKKIEDLEFRIDELESTVRDLRIAVNDLEGLLGRVETLETTVSGLEWVQYVVQDLEIEMEDLQTLLYGVTREDDYIFFRGINFHGINIQTGEFSGGGVYVTDPDSLIAKLGDGGSRDDIGILQLYDKLGSEKIRLYARDTTPSWITSGSLGIGTTDQFGGGVGILSLGNAHTIPSSALTNAAALFASGGEMYAYDALGNATLISPHDFETGEWIFYSKNVRTGRVVRVNYEEIDIQN
jgi:hypothetical protein